MHQCHTHYLLLLSLKNGRCSGFEYHFQTIDSLNMCVSTVATVPLTHSLPHATRPFIRRTSSGNVHCAFACTLSTYSGVLFLSRGTSSNSASVGCQGRRRVVPQRRRVRQQRAAPDTVDPWADANQHHYVPRRVFERFLQGKVFLVIPVTCLLHELPLVVETTILEAFQHLHLEHVAVVSSVCAYNHCGRA